jgi:hypothetical protein
MAMKKVTTLDLDLVNPTLYRQLAYRFFDVFGQH